MFVRRIFVFFLLACAAGSNAQFAVSGKVTGESGEGLPGANVLLAGTGFGTITDESGEYLMESVPAGDYQLEVSYVGYETYRREINVDKNVTSHVSLAPAMIWGEDIIVKATRADASTPASYSEVDKEELAKKNLGQDIPFLLSLEPSLVTTSDAGAGVGYTGMWIRGSNIQRINVTVNGIPLNDPESHGVFWVNMPDFASSVESIQIQRGVGTSTNGGGAFGANLNLETDHFQREAYAELNNSFGSFNTWKNTIELGTGLIRDHWVFSGRASSIRSDGYVDRASSDLSSYFLQGGYYGKNTSLKAIVFGGKEKTYQSWNGIDSATLANDRTFNSAGAIYDESWNILGFYDNETDNYRQDHYQLHFTQLLGSQFELNAALHYTYGRGYYEQYYSNQYYGDYPIGVQYFGLDSTDTGSGYEYFYHDSVAYGDMIVRRWLDNHFYGVTYALHYTLDNLQLTVGGASNQYADAKHYGEIIWSEFTGETAIRDRYYDNVSDKSDHNIYGKFKYTLLGNLGLFADLQLRFVSYLGEGTDSDGSTIGIDESWQFFNPKLGLIYDVSKQSSLYGSWSVAHREPIRTDFLDAPSGLSPEPERLQDIELGVRGSGNRFYYRANGYLMLYENQLVLTGEINDVGSPIRSNVGESYRLGLELDGGFQVNSFLRLAANLSLSQNTTDYTTIEEDEFVEYNNTPLSYSPSVVSALQIAFLPVKQLEVILDGKFVGRQYLDLTGSEARSLDPYFVNNLMFIYRVKPAFMKELGLSFRIHNLFDVEYVSNGYTWGSTPYYYPQAGIHFTGGLSMRF